MDGNNLDTSILLKLLDCLGKADEKLGHMWGKLASVLAEAQKTNGRITKLEEEFTEMKIAQAAMRGRVAGIAATVGALVTVAGGWVKSMVGK